MSTGTPHALRRQLQFTAWDDVIRDVERLRDGGYFRTGKWTLSQVCDHLGLFLRWSLDGYPQRIPWLVRVTLGKYLLRKVLRNRGMAPGQRVPRSFLPGDPRADLPAVAEFIDLVRRFQQHTGPYRPSPMFGDLSRETTHQLQLIHASHHLSFLVPAAAAGGE